MIINRKFIFGVIVMFSSVCVAGARTTPNRNTIFRLTERATPQVSVLNGPTSYIVETQRPETRAIKMMHGWRPER